MAVQKEFAGKLGWAYKAMSYHLAENNLMEADGPISKWAKNCHHIFKK